MGGEIAQNALNQDLGFWPSQEFGAFSAIHQHKGLRKKTKISSHDSFYKQEYDTFNLRIFFDLNSEIHH